MGCLTQRYQPNSSKTLTKKDNPPPYRSIILKEHKNLCYGTFRPSAIWRPPTKLVAIMIALYLINSRASGFRSSLRPPDGSSEEKDTTYSNSRLQKRLVDLLWNCHDLTLDECKEKYITMKDKRKIQHDEFAKRLKERLKRMPPTSSEQIGGLPFFEPFMEDRHTFRIH